jgi:hypothetical protein
VGKANPQLSLEVNLRKNYGSSASNVRLSTVHVVLDAPLCEINPGSIAVRQRLRPPPGEDWKGVRVRHDSGAGTSEPERFVPCSERIVLGCECGERLVLLGLEEDWRSEHYALFECECGERLTFADRIDEEALAAVELLRGLRDPGTARAGGAASTRPRWRRPAFSPSGGPLPWVLGYVPKVLRRVSVAYDDRDMGANAYNREHP